MKNVTVDSTLREYRRGLAHNSSIGLEDELRRAHNFVIGKQWEGVDAPQLPKPVFNFIKRTVIYTVQNLSSTSLKLSATSLGGSHPRLERALNMELDNIFEHNSLIELFWDFLHSAAIRGDACLVARWDSDALNHRGERGSIVAEAVENDRVFFGATSSDEVDDQPYIIISRRERLENVRKLIKARAAEVGEPAPELRPDIDAYEIPFKDDDADSATVLLRFWKNADTGTIWCFECCRGAIIRDAWDTGLTRYPIIWMPWDKSPDTYHGQSLVTSLIPNQIFVNKLFAMSMLTLMTISHPKIVYDRTRISKWDNRVGAAIPMLGGDVNSVARVIEPAHLSPQIAQFIDMTVSYSQTLLGATPAALGEVRPDNSSAIIALQKASSLPNELARRRLYREIERFGRILIEMIGEYYGVTPVPDGDRVELIDFSQLKSAGVTLRLDVGSAAHWSEFSIVGTLDNLLSKGLITFEEYLERLPDAYLPGKYELLERTKTPNS